MLPAAGTARAAAALALVVSAGLGGVRPAQAEVRSVAVHAPRTFGYFIGDAIPVTIRIEADAGDRFDPASLPRPGALDYWLDLTGVETSEGKAPDGGRLLTLRLVLQTFYAALEPRVLDVPSFEVRIVGPDGNSSTARVPGWPLTVSPLREIIPQGGSDATRLEPDASPVFRTTRTAAFGLAGFLAVAVGGLVAVAANRSWWPFHRRPSRPFTRAARELRRVGGAGDPYRTSLVVHRAFDEAAGRRLLADDLPAFLAARPWLAAEAEGAASFFEQSRRLFFLPGGNTVDGRENRNLEAREIVALAVRLAVLERRAP